MKVVFNFKSKYKIKIYKYNDTKYFNKNINNTESYYDNA